MIDTCTKMDILRRIATFASSKHTQASLLVKAGFVYVQDTDSLVCTKCGYTSQTDNVAQHGTSCKIDCPSTTVTTLQNSLTDLTESKLKSTVETLIKRSCPPDCKKQQQEEVDVQSAKNFEMANAHARRESFRDKEYKYPFSTDKCVDAGLYYQGPKDNVRCFYCDGGLTNFKKTDDPWVEHCKWFPDCKFVLFRDKYNKCKIPLQSQSKPKYVLDNREMQGRLASPKIKILLDQGFAVSDIKTALQRQFALVGDDYTSIAHIVEDIFALKDFRVELNVNQVINSISHMKLVNSDLSELVTKYETLNNLITCKICMDKRIDIVFLPCGHFVTCNVCAPQITNCCICRSLVRGTCTVQP